MNYIQSERAHFLRRHLPVDVPHSDPLSCARQQQQQEQQQKCPCRSGAFNQRQRYSQS